MSSTDSASSAVDQVAPSTSASTYASEHGGDSTTQTQRNTDASTKEQKSSRKRKSHRRSRSRSSSSSRPSSRSSHSRSRSRSPPPSRSRSRSRSRDRKSSSRRAPAPSSSTSEEQPVSKMTSSAATAASSSSASGAAVAAPASRPLTATRGGVYIPPHKLRAMEAEMLAKSSPQDETHQKIRWEALRKSINGLINKANVSNLKHILPELFAENIIRGRGILVKSIMKAQITSSSFTAIYAALVAVLNTRMPEIGELLCKRLLTQFRRAFKRNDKGVCLATEKFIAHLTNQAVLHELVALQLLTVLLEKPTDDSVELAVDFIKECGAALTTITPTGVHGIFERFRSILHEGEIDLRVETLVTNLFAIRKSNFKDYPAIQPDLDLVETEDQITHELSLDEEYDVENSLNIFKYDPAYEANEAAYAEIKREIVGDEEAGEEDAEASGEQPDEPGSSDQNMADITQAQGSEENNGMAIEDWTEQDIINLRRSIYLTIMSSLNFEEVTHKLMKLKVLPGQEKELANMIIECCCADRTYNKLYGLVGERLCNLRRDYQDCFNDAFAQNYALIHRLETNRLRNMAKFYAHLLYTDALDWSCLEYIQLTEEDTTSAGRIFIRYLFRELSELLGLSRLRKKVNDPKLEKSLAGLFPKEQPKHTRFAINFFTSIGLGGLTEGLREHLKNAPKVIMAATTGMEDDDDDDSDSDSDSSSDSSSDSDSDSDSDSASSDSSSDSDSSSSDSDSDSDSDSSSSSSSSSSESESDDDRRKRKKRRSSPKKEKSDSVKKEGDSGSTKVKVEPGLEGQEPVAATSSSRKEGESHRSSSRRSRSRSGDRRDRRDERSSRRDSRERRHDSRERHTSSRRDSRDRDRRKEDESRSHRSDRTDRDSHRSREITSDRRDRSDRHESQRKRSRSRSKSKNRDSRRSSSRSASPKRRKRD